MDDFSHYPWRALLEGQGIATIRDMGENIVSHCPFCHHERHTTFSLSLSKGLWICFRCGKKGNAAMLLSELFNISYEEAEHRLRLGTAWRETEKKKPVPSLRLPYEFESLKLPETIGNRRFWKYARRRRLTPALVEEYDVGFCREGFLDGRLVIPFRWEGQLISYFARDITGRQAVKVITCPGGRHAKYLFNLDRVQRDDILIVVEGVFDCLTLADRAVSTSGKRISEDQILQLAASDFRTVCLCWDEDALREAHETAQRLAELMINIQLVLLPSGDPNQLGRKTVLEAVAQARSPTALQGVELWGERRVRR